MKPKAQLPWSKIIQNKTYVWYISVDCSVRRQHWCSVNNK